LNLATLLLMAASSCGSPLSSSLLSVDNSGFSIPVWMNADGEADNRGRRKRPVEPDNPGSWLPGSVRTSRASRFGTLNSGAGSAHAPFTSIGGGAAGMGSHNAPAAYGAPGAGAGTISHIAGAESAFSFNMQSAFQSHPSSDPAYLSMRSAGESLDYGMGGVIMMFSSYDGAFAVVPEPGSLSLAALGFVGLFAWCWRRRR
jgi:hypothetical protein